MDTTQKTSAAFALRERLVAALELSPRGLDKEEVYEIIAGVLEDVGLGKTVIVSEKIWDVYNKTNAMFSTVVEEYNLAALPLVEKGRRLVEAGDLRPGFTRQPLTLSADWMLALMKAYYNKEEWAAIVAHFE